MPQKVFSNHQREKISQLQFLTNFLLIVVSTRSYEIRQLESKLREGYVNKERHAQMAEKEAHKFDSLIEDAEIMRRMKLEAERAQHEESLRQQERAVENRRYKQDIHRQIEEKEESRQKAYEEFLKEKLLIDEIVRKLYEEDQREVV